MDNYILVYKNGQKKDWCTKLELKNTQPNLIYFICRKETIISYRYGEHANYTFCDRDGNDMPLLVGDTAFFSFKTSGTQRRFILSWEIEQYGIKEEYALYRDDIFYYSPSVADEWADPITDTIRLIQDILRFGLATRKELDALKRELYSYDLNIKWRIKRYSHLKDIDFEKSGLILSTYNVQLPCVEKEYKKTADIKSRLNVQDALAFLRDERDKREHSVELLDEGNKFLEEYASSLERVFIKDGVTTIENGQFDDCKKARIIVLPTSVTCIIQTAFNYTHVESVYIKSSTLAQLSASSPAPGIMLTKAKFYVPQNLLESYKTNFFWKSLADRLFTIKEDEQL